MKGSLSSSGELCSTACGPFTVNSDAEMIHSVFHSVATNSNKSSIVFALIKQIRCNRNIRSFCFSLLFVKGVKKKKKNSNTDCSKQTQNVFLLFYSFFPFLCFIYLFFTFFPFLPFSFLGLYLLVQNFPI